MTSVVKIHDKFLPFKELLNEFTKKFRTTGEEFVKGDRNILKMFDLNDDTIVIKSFKRPNMINRVVFKYFRPSKARRSYYNSLELLKRGILTPEPIGFYENFDSVSLMDSYYASKKIEPDIIFMDIVRRKDYKSPESRNFLDQFAAFAFQLHENGIKFNDFSPGNVLALEQDGKYTFYLVDVNRMKFREKLSYKDRLKNFRRLQYNKYMIATISRRYAELYNMPASQLFKDLSVELKSFTFRYQLKHKLKFWKRWRKSK